MCCLSVSSQQQKWKENTTSLSTLQLFPFSLSSQLGGVWVGFCLGQEIKLWRAFVSKDPCAYVFLFLGKKKFVGVEFWKPMLSMMEYKKLSMGPPRTEALCIPFNNLHTFQLLHILANTYVVGVITPDTIVLCNSISLCLLFLLIWRLMTPSLFSLGCFQGFQEFFMSLEKVGGSAGI